MRAAALVHGAMVAGAGGSSRELIHVTDWLPTLVRAGWGRCRCGLLGGSPAATFHSVIKTD